MDLAEFSTPSCAREEPQRRTRPRLFNDRSNAPEVRAFCLQASEQIQAPRPLLEPPNTRSSPSMRLVTRSMVAASFAVRQPTQVLTGPGTFIATEAPPPALHQTTGSVSPRCSTCFASPGNKITVPPGAVHRHGGSASGAASNHWIGLVGLLSRHRFA